MTKQREAIYRKLLYIGLVDIRNFSHRASQKTANIWFPPLTQDEVAAYIAGLADLLHDLALHSAKDFEGWNDEYFAIGYKNFCEAFSIERYPALIHEVVRQLENN